MGLARKILAGGFLIGSLALGSCRLEGPLPSPEELADEDSSMNSEYTEDYTLVKISENVLGRGYEMPEGLRLKSFSYKKQFNKSLSVDDEGTLSSVFLERPTFKILRSDKTFEVGPKINSLSGTLEDVVSGTVSINTLFSFSQDYLSDFNSFQFQEINSILRPLGLFLRTLPLGNDYFLISSNFSNKLFGIVKDIDGIYNSEIFKQEDELIGINDMILGSDGKIYVTQSPILEYTTYPEIRLIRKKRVISIDDKNNINEEFSLPDGVVSKFFTKIPDSNLLYGGYFNPGDEQLRIEENSSDGKTKTNIEFFVSDFLSGIIYSVSKNSEGIYQTSVLKEVPYPLAVEVEQNGNLFVVTGPIFRDSDSEPGIQSLSFLKNSEIIKIDPSDVTNTTSIYTIPEELEDFPGAFQPISNSSYEDYFPTGYSVSIGIAEDTDTLTFLLSNTHSGKVNAVQFKKVY
ncbi:hypothetical protein DRN69_01695 [Candidatus Pacearchaeota archaeon]|nr:MAG: hypothetical protein DRN69_01695 [Candidatus Pacearchaeota archaeon]